VIIGGPVKIGKNCNISHCVTLGQTLRGPTKGHPTIDDNVWIGAGSVITGKIKIGRNVLIAPNSFVSFNVPDNSLVVGNPAKIFSKADATAGYINNIMEV
jgi:serine O-acetyltransferase